MVLQSTRWLALGYFTYFFSYGIFPDEKLMQNSVFIMKMMPKRTTKL